MKWEFKFSMKNEFAGEIYSAIKVEKNTGKYGESNDAKIYLEGNTLRLLLQAEDVPSLRAKVNTWLRLIKVCLDVLDALKAYNRLS